MMSSMPLGSVLLFPRSLQKLDLTISSKTTVVSSSPNLALQLQEEMQLQGISAQRKSETLAPMQEEARGEQ